MTSPVEMDWPQSGGELLAASSPLPAGWQRGIGFLDPSCLSPVVLGECPTGASLKPTQRPGSAEFRPVTVVQAVECTTFGHLDVPALSANQLDRTRDFALARELLTGEASARDTPAGGNPSLIDTATDLGEVATTAQALGCLEATLLRANSGRGAVLLMPVEVASQALADGSLWRDGARWRTAAGARVIVSAAFDGRGPTALPELTAPPAPGDALYTYAVTALWSGVGVGDDRATYSAVDRSINTVDARSEDIMMSAFSTCAVFAIATSAVTACAGPAESI